ncbi:MAG TPA: HEAT repeat domain-containing protein, partial [Gemmataceae bacterium]|nr:HEAT repeat domain-containing protein [Gemmataceae bacterium]
MHMQRHCFLALSSVIFLLSAQGVCRGEDLGLRVPPGFRVSVYADHELANDIFAMTLDAKGRVVVTGPGYIKTLHDTRGAGKADRATLFASPRDGGMGMCFDGNDLYFCGGGWLSRYRDAHGSGHADGPPERIIPLAHAEHGGHALRKGPDGWWYIIGGNDSKFGRAHATLPHSPVTRPEGGALLRLPPDCRHCEVIAQGFRNPYDFDFNAQGDIFTYDSDCEREFFLPWYTPTRMYHVGYRQHHGWRLAGYLRSWCRRDFYIDTVDVLWPVGRGSPTGVACYRHAQFPEHYRGGIFALDWTFGKVYFFALQPDGATYRTQAEVFLESTGSNGFDPTDVAVAPDGALFISMGGRGTRGAVYRIEYVGDGKPPAEPAVSARSEIESVLHAPQPLDAWSRARWMPLARKLGASAFAAVAEDEKCDATARVRAFEILTELFGGLSESTAKQCAASRAPAVRARVAWSIGRVPLNNGEAVVARLAQDADATVRRNALETLADQLARTEAATKDVVAILLSNFNHPDERVRQAAARAAGLLPEGAFASLQFLAKSDKPQAQLTAALAALWRAPNESAASALSASAGILRSSHENDLLLQ